MPVLKASSLEGVKSKKRTVLAMRLNGGNAQGLGLGLACRVAVAGLSPQQAAALRDSLQRISGPGPPALQDDNAAGWDIWHHEGLRVATISLQGSRSCLDTQLCAAAEMSPHVLVVHINAENMNDHEATSAISRFKGTILVIGDVCRLGQATDLLRALGITDQWQPNPEENE